MVRPPKFEAGELGDGQGEGRFKTAEEALSDSAVEEAGPAVRERVDIEEAREIMGENFFGPEEVEEVFGLVSEHIPAIPFPADVLQRAKQQNYQLVYFVDELPGPAVGSGIPLTIKNLERAVATSKEGNLIWPGTVWDKQYFIENETPRPGWRLVGTEVINKAGDAYLAESYLEQVDTVVLTRAGELYNGTKKGMPSGFAWAIDGYRKRREQLIKIQAASPPDAAKMLLEDAVSDYFLENAVETAYRAVLANQLGRSGLLVGEALWTKSHRTGSAGKFGSNVGENLFGQKICIELIPGGRIGYKALPVEERTTRAGVVASFRGN